MNKHKNHLVSWLQYDRGVVIRTYEDYKKLKAKVESLGDTLNCMPDDTKEAFKNHLDKHGVDLRDGTRGLIVTTIPEFGYYWSWTLESYEEEYGQYAPYELSEIGVE
jgi:hypothetical protein